MKKRIVSLLLVFCMVITLVPANVLADEVKGLAETTAGQTQTAGTTAAKPENPFADVKSGSWYGAAVLYARDQRDDLRAGLPDDARDVRHGARPHGGR